MAWFLVPYKRRSSSLGPERYCAMDDFTALIQADGGRWSEAECLGNHAVVKVQALPATLTIIAAEPTFQRLPKNLLDEPLSDLTNAQKKAINDKLEALGYSATEIRDSLGVNIGTKTLRDVLRFVLTRRLRPRYDSITDQIILDGPVQMCKTIEAVNSEV